MKHDHKKTKKLKVALFAIIMFLPFIAIGITCATHIFNEEVQAETQTVDIEYQYDTNNPQEEIIQNNIYNISFNGTLQQLRGELDENNISFILVSGDITYTNCHWQSNESVPNEEYIISPSYTNISIEEEYIFMYLNANGTYMTYFLYQDTSMNLTNISIEGEILITNWNISDNTTLLPSSLSIATDIPIESVNVTTVAQDETTNIFYDSCDQVQDSFVLNWCTNGNPIRNGINAFTNAFNLPNEHMINTLLTYWLCISMIYIVIDIIIECIVYITHFFNKEV